MEHPLEIYESLSQPEPQLPLPFRNDMILNLQSTPRKYEQMFLGDWTLNAAELLFKSGWRLLDSQSWSHYSKLNQTFTIQQAYAIYKKEIEHEPS
jgi:hypothetical protein